MSAPAQSPYRPDIDGLRAVAVMAVVLFHAGVDRLGGGYVGVDVFFVISGYLITGIIARDLDAGRFSLLRFYERRARRILPALLVLLAAVLVASALLLLPGDFEKVPPSALAGLGFAANLWFFATTGYFDTSALTKPLLHLWSLGVEEQFYIGFPWLLMLAAGAWARGRAAIVWAAGGLSLVVCLATSGAGDGFAFYMLPARAWELLAGSAIALGGVPAVKARGVREAVAAGGLAAILAACLAYHEATRFPGLAALPPVLGAAALIHCAPGTRTGALLAARPMVRIGQQSYSLYLWHWPLIVFARYAKGAALAPLEAALVVAAALALGEASLRLVEAPFRDPRTMPRHRLAAVLAGAALVVAGGWSWAYAQGPWASRFPPAAARYAAARQDVSPVRDTCLVTRMAGPDPRCVFGNPARVDTLVWGDSHAVEFAWALGEAARARGGGVIERTMGSCPPVLDWDDPAIRDCRRFNTAVWDELAERPEIRTVWLSAYWAGGRYDRAGPALVATAARLRAAGREVVLVGAVPSQAFAVPRTLAAHAAWGRAVPPTRTRAAHERTVAWLRAAEPALRAAGVRIVDPADRLFAASTGTAASAIVAHGRPLYFDNHHLTLTGARLVLAGRQ